MLDLLLVGFILFAWVYSVVFYRVDSFCVLLLCVDFILLLALNVGFDLYVCG